MRHPTIYIHHDAYTLSGKHLHTVNQQHKTENYPISTLGYYTFYQYFIERDGKTTQTRPDKDPLVVYKPAHLNSISIGLAGNFDHYPQSDEQDKALTKLFEKFRVKYHITALHIKEHRDYQKTSCPGSRIERGYFAKLFIETQLSGVQKSLYSAILKMLRVVKYRNATR